MCSGARAAADRGVECVSEVFLFFFFHPSIFFYLYGWTSASGVFSRSYMNKSIPVSSRLRESFANFTFGRRLPLTPAVEYNTRARQKKKHKKKK